MTAEQMAREQLAESENELAARLAASRALTHAALGELHKRHSEARASAARHAALVEENRTLRTCHDRQMAYARECYARIAHEVRRLRACVVAAEVRAT